MNTPQCAMTGVPIHDSSDGIYDDGEWISWEWINAQLEEETHPDDIHEEIYERQGAPRILELTEVFLELVDTARRYKNLTGRYLEIWGELGEMYAEIRHGLVRHPKHHPGSDGTISGALVEVKTISPEKKNDRVMVKRAGDFEKLLIVRVSEDFWFTSKLLDRSALKEGAKPLIKARWTEDEQGP